MAFCGQCGSALGDADKFCPNCGAATASEHTEPAQVVDHIDTKSMRSRMWIPLVTVIFAVVALLLVTRGGGKEALNKVSIEEAVNTYLAADTSDREDLCYQFGRVSFGDPNQFFQVYSEFGVGNPKGYHVVEVTAPFRYKDQLRFGQLISGLRELGFLAIDVNGQTEFPFRPSVPLAPTYRISLLKPLIDPHLTKPQDGSQRSDLSICYAKLVVDEVERWTDNEASQSKAIVRIKAATLPPFDQSASFNQIVEDLNKQHAEKLYEAMLVKMNDGWHVESIGLTSH